jgi:Tol biopolymer transport system component
LFTSDAGGGDNIWIMDADGSDAKQITEESFACSTILPGCPTGNTFIARKHFTSGRSLGAGEMWMYHITGGSGIQLTKRKNDQQDVNEPSRSPQMAATFTIVRICIPVVIFNTIKIPIARSM